MFCRIQKLPSRKVEIMIHPAQESKCYGHACYYSHNTIESLQWSIINGSVQDCSNSIANALELLKSCTEPSIYAYCHHGICDKNIMAAIYNWLLQITMLHYPR